MCEPKRGPVYRIKYPRSEGQSILKSTGRVTGICSYTETAKEKRVRRSCWKQQWTQSWDQQVDFGCYSGKDKLLELAVNSSVDWFDLNFKPLLWLLLRIDPGKKRRKQQCGQRDIQVMKLGLTSGGLHGETWPSGVTCCVGHRAKVFTWRRRFCYVIPTCVRTHICSSSNHSQY